MIKENLINELLEAVEKTGTNSEILTAIEIIKKHDDEEIRKLLAFDKEYKKELINFFYICYDAKIILKVIEKNQLRKYIQDISDYTIADNEIKLLEACKNIVNYYEFVGIKTICIEYYETFFEMVKQLESIVLKYQNFDNKIINNILNSINEKNINHIERLKQETKSEMEVYQKKGFYKINDYCIRVYLLDVIYLKKYLCHIPELSECLNVVINLKISQKEKLDLISNIFNIGNLIAKSEEINEQINQEIEGRNKPLNLL